MTLDIESDFSVHRDSAALGLESMAPSMVRLHGALLEASRLPRPFGEAFGTRLVDGERRILILGVEEQRKALASSHEVQKSLLDEVTVNRDDARQTIFALLDVDPPNARFFNDVLGF
jgi:hypothetical protein